MSLGSAFGGSDFRAEGLGESLICYCTEEEHPSAKELQNFLIPESCEISSAARMYAQVCGLCFFHELKLKPCNKMARYWTTSLAAA